MATTIADSVHVAGTRANALIVVPVMLQRILDCGPEAISEHHHSSLRVIAVSGSALPGPLAGPRPRQPGALQGSA
jgi:hypothetical protein